MPHLYAIAIGSNRPHGRHGRPRQVVLSAIAELDRRFGLFDASPILLNPASGGAGRNFANAAALIETEMEPRALLAELKQLEGQFGRRPGRRWGARVLDLDILLWSGGRFRCRQLTVPHPRLPDRPFVLQPLLAIAPGWRVAGPQTVRHLAHRLARRRPRS
ncbi:MAG: 2-amino-4-hydroxy-6-hydroxymethyldihydropteridinepyrophosphokinase [uncultured Sphingomonas sp.]|uniref:2-amino-4-hydroxy-6-hydroxymethyldihydropteridine pyrophosphokinase n=1 Tax=uncultured Sphingomonas sp. TaxID=158754 RepID=A0A6J4TNL3_9SPHN|nr:2-amino-4-hydroxy-6-hydroxymethyldihydropteridine diphosphokinase [uncultured Sphingomonas sp.]CAA9526504.1 MAG: 2-amino-4-hydroxy-6-hydroxymethyldihydropteridinepyrophosphokinase [uncultured Sphingomonas sp.]